MYKTCDEPPELAEVQARRRCRAALEGCVCSSRRSSYSGAHRCGEPFQGCTSEPIFLVSEPTGLFDRLQQQGNTIVLVTHEPDIAEYAHRIIHVRDGKVEKDEAKR